ncbi:MAG: hypothetical protein ACLRSW_01130 [Christensenellaceae bacterium]
MVLPQGVTAEIITAKSSGTTPSNWMRTSVLLQEYGYYDYSVTAAERRYETFIPRSVLIKTPQIVRAAERRNSCGLYNDFESDISTMEVVCKNEALVNI